MQLRDRRKRRAVPLPVGGSVAAATCALLGPGAPTHVLAQELEPWDLDTAILYYGESDGRVRDVSLNAIAIKELTENGFLSLSLAIDTLTGASPSGAAPSPVPQTFTRPSGGGSYVVAPGAIPLDDSFLDTRTALSANWSWPLTRLTTFDIGASVSDEYDYTHTGLNARIARDFNDRNTTLSFGLALASDTVDPVGGVPLPLTPMLTGEDDDGRDDDDDGDDDDGAHGTEGADRAKDVVDVLVGVTQVLNRHTIVQLNYSLSQSDGYLTDPYKILSVVDPVSGLPVAGPAGTDLNLYLYESRPETRDKQSLYMLLKRDFNGDVLDASYRYMTDDWGIDSHTVDLHYRWKLGGGAYIQPHVRYYTQSAATFYGTVLFDGQIPVQFASADYRLAQLDAVTLGIKYGKMTQRGELSGRLELYHQTGEPSPGAAVGALSGLQLYPDLDAVIAQLGYRFGR